MKEWHIQHMEKTVIKYIKGLPENATAWEKRQHRRYGGITRVCRQINYDIKHGVTNEQVLELLEAIKTDSSYLDLKMMWIVWIDWPRLRVCLFTRHKPLRVQDILWNNIPEIARWINAKY